MLKARDKHLLKEKLTFQSIGVMVVKQASRTATLYFSFFYPHYKLKINVYMAGEIIHITVHLETKINKIKVYISA